MEILASQQVNIYPHQPRRVSPCEVDFVDHTALYRLYKETVLPPNYLTYPFQVRTHLARDPIAKEDSVNFGMCIPYPYCLRGDTRFGRLARNPLYGAEVYINLAACENPDTSIIDVSRECKDISPILLAANYTFMHEWRHLIRLAEGGLAYYSSVEDRCNDDCLYKLCLPNTCLLDEYEDEDCEGFAIEQTLKIVRRESLPIIKKIP